ncbi:TIGR02611 family protein [Blastococcus sp. Marseille-P5729]|uniref:TIGR02611 family protein n=1 Tax=Blastococcus sp. Marseille-P5729 TaxID=2086582 RepID=UPI001F2E07F2|nr:TIGR02611 family protein [Blastococcus sp. Marseille-P5729]
MYPNEPGLLDDVADRLGFRHRLERKPALKTAYRIGVGMVGTVVLLAGIVMIPFPGPGWLVVIAGLAILATEFAWAERLLHFTKRHVLSWTRWVNSQPIWIRLLIGLATALFVYGVVVLALRITGVPGWVPDWVPLWR